MLWLTFLIPAFAASADSKFPDQLLSFKASLLNEHAHVTYNIDEIHNRYPKPLLSEESLLPQTSIYPLKDIRRLYQAGEKCQGPWPVSPRVTDPLVFTRAMCNKTELPIGWFARSNLIHPGGGSYASRFAQLFPNRTDELIPYFHVRERALAEKDSLLGRLQAMPEGAVDALAAGATSLLSGDELWMRDNDNYKVYPSDVWRPFIEDLGLQISMWNNTSYCLYQSGNICWNKEGSGAYWSWVAAILVVVNVGAIGGWAFQRWRSNRRVMQERMLVLQILTHELRTPIASLAMTVEGFRRQFDSLPEGLYGEYRRLCDDTRRLKQLAEASKDYLQSRQQTLNTEEIPSIEEWLEYVCEPHGVTPQLQEDRSVNVNVYWLTTCVDNLISNAVKYGVQPVTVSADTSSGKLVIEVKDQGGLTSKDWKTIRKPFVSERGLGLGLTIVESMITRMGGKMILQGPPTTFRLEIPCDANNATAR
ncbi:sensor histidine kinase [Parasalinivibrio latis]